MSAYTFFSRSKFTNFFSFNTGENVLINDVYSLSISSFVPQTFALKFESFPKPCRIFALPNFKEVVLPRPSTQLILPR